MSREQLESTADHARDPEGDSGGLTSEKIRFNLLHFCDMGRRCEEERKPEARARELSAPRSGPAQKNWAGS